MTDLECAEFLQWCLPKLRLRWAGFRKVRKQVCKRLNRRMKELNLLSLSAYRDHLLNRGEEWRVLDSLCKITISRFYRDRGIFDAIRSRILPALAGDALEKREGEVRCWSAGCCSGEEAYTLQILWRMWKSPSFRSGLSLKVVATDADPALLERAGRGSFPESSLRDLPKEWIQQAFIREGKFYRIEKAFKENIEFLKQDIRVEFPEGFFHLILCRNFVFTYFEETLQREILERILGKLNPNGVLIIGSHESLPRGAIRVIPHPGLTRSFYVFQPEP